MSVSRRGLVTMAEGTHAYPYRTRELSPPAPMILGAGAPGKVGGCQAQDTAPGGEHPRSPRVFCCDGGALLGLVSYRQDSPYSPYGKQDALGLTFRDMIVLRHIMCYTDQCL